jgi:hypothetical protein
MPKALIISVASSSPGGPIIILDALGRAVQVGVSSFITTVTAPSGFARVSNGFDWIKSTICLQIPTDTKFCLTPAPTIRPTTFRPTSKAAKNAKSNLFV